MTVGKKKMKKMNSFEAQPRSLDPSFKQYLSRYFAEDIEELGKLFGRNLADWSHDGVSQETQR